LPVQDVPVEKIVVPDVRVSAKFDEEQLAMFKASIEKIGVIQDPVVRRLPDGRYEVVAGAHRIRELAERGAKAVRCKVVEVDDLSAIEMNISENLARGSYDPMEVSLQLNNYLERGGSIEDLVRLTGHSRRWVEKYISLVKLPEEFQQALSSGLLRIGHIEEAFRLDGEAEVYDALKTAVVHKWPVNILRNYVNNRLEELRLVEEARRRGLQPPEIPGPRPELADLAECWSCRRKLSRKQMRMPQMCVECWALLNYCTSQLGEPREAMQKVYEAVTFKQQYDLWRQHRFEEFERAARPPRRTPTPQSRTREG